VLIFRAAQLHIDYPMLFQVENRRDARSTHCGVLEFIADEGMVYMPYWVRGCCLACCGCCCCCCCCLDLPHTGVLPGSYVLEFIADEGMVYMQCWVRGGCLACYGAAEGCCCLCCCCCFVGLLSYCCCTYCCCCNCWCLRQLHEL